jgi:hypothetical protein
MAVVFGFNRHFLTKLKKRGSPNKKSYVAYSRKGGLRPDYILLPKVIKHLVTWLLELDGKSIPQDYAQSAYVCFYRV